MPWNLVVAVLLITVGMAVAATDVIASWKGTSSVSSLIRSWSADVPMLPFGVGVLTGHLFW